MQKYNTDLNKGAIVRLLFFNVSTRGPATDLWIVHGVQTCPHLVTAGNDSCDPEYDMWKWKKITE